MDEMTAFDQQIAREVVREAGPSEPVDGAAIFTAITTTQSPKWRFQSMFSATKFLVAGAVVALFGGLLLAGVLTQPSDKQVPAAAASASASPEADASNRAERSDLLPGVDLVTEEVEPGVYRVVSDGARELSGLPADDERRYMGGVLDTNIAAGLDGSIWLFGLDGFYRLGADAMHQWFEDSWRDARPGQADIEVGPSGTVWLQPTDGGDIRSFDGESWTTRRESSKDEVLSGLAVEQDGTVLTTWSTNPPGGRNKPQPRTIVARLGADRWEDLPGSVEGVAVFHDVMVTDGGGEEVWLMPGFGRLRRHDGTGWVVQPTPEAGGEVRAAVGPDGTLWVRLVRCGSSTGCEGQAMSNRSAILARFDGEAWEVFRAKDGIPMMGDHYQGFEGFFEVAPDRSIWFNPALGPDPGSGTDCDGVASFDGQSLHRYLRGHCITAMDIARDGTVWLRATERMPDGSRTPESPSRYMWLPNEPVHTYAIAPRSATATAQ